MLSKWSGWGALPQVFDPRNTEPWATSTRGFLASNLSQDEYQRAQASTINAHYTSPEVARIMWQTMTRLGFTPSTVWEPGAGIGVFVAAAPESAQVTGVELDPKTAQIFRRLHPGHDLIEGDLTKVEVDGRYDAAIGNVPFSSARIYDRDLSPGRELSLHNYVIRKALAAVKPGAPVMLITSSYTLDATHPKQRQILSGHGDFLGAVRLPSSAFEAQSGTQVTTDIILMRRHDKPDLDLSDGRLDGWRNTREITLETDDDEVVRVNVNEWFLQHPELVVGEWKLGTMSGRPHAAVGLEPSELAARLNTAMTGLEELARPQLAIPVTATETPTPTLNTQSTVERPPHIKPGGLWGDSAEGGVWQWDLDGQIKPFKATPKRDTYLLDKALALRDSYVTLVEAELAGATNIEALRADLNRAYTQFTAANNGNPVTWHTLKTNKRGESLPSWPPLGGMRRHDPDYALICGLDTYDPETGTTTKAAIFDGRQVAQQSEPKVQGIEDAIAVSMHRHNRIDPETIAQLLAKPVGSVRALLEQTGEAFRDPATNMWVDKATYLSGNVREKRDLVTKVIELGTGAGMDLRPNLAALNSVVPPDVPIDDINVQLGVSWLTPDEIKSFIRELLEHELPSVEVDYHEQIGWSTNLADVGPRWGPMFTEVWGTDRYPAPRLIEAGLRQRPIVVYDSVPDGRRVLNYEATVEAQQKLQEINIALGEWIAGDPTRAGTISTRYNKLFSSHAPRTHDTDYRPVGLAADIQLRPAQAEALQDAIRNRRLGLYHVVGAGKTLTMSSAAMEMRRLGIANKPLVVAPAHLVAQITGEWQRAFPAAKLLSQTGKTSPAERMRLGSQAAAGDWDGIIISQTTYDTVPVSPEAEFAFTERQIAVYVEALSAAKDDRTVKQLEKRKLDAENRLKELLDGKTDDGFPLEAWGVDALIADEAHAYKNLDLQSSRSDMTYAASKRAARFDLKLEILREITPDLPIILATGTPIANSFHELWVMMHYVSPELLNQAGLGRFDAFATQFGQTIADYEMTASGGYQLKSRFASFRNVPELQAMFTQHASVKLAEDLNLPRPELEDGDRKHLTVPTSPQMRAFITELEHRANNMPDDRSKYNHLKIMTEARAAAISLELVDRKDPPINKITVLAEAVADRYAQEKDNVYLTGDQSPHPVTGSLQVIFLDRGTPTGSTNLYSVIRDELVGQGVPFDRIAFVHDHDRDLPGLFRGCREGRYNVLIGSTDKMGTGMNVQTRATALYHVDPPWRPADLEQRDGRILRQGNQNDHVAIYYVINEGSADALSYQTLERKQKMIDLVLTNRNTQRTIQAVDRGDNLDFGALKSLSTGNPHTIELLRAKQHLGEITIAHNAYQRRIKNANRRMNTFDQTIPNLQHRLEVVTAALAANLTPRHLTATDNIIRARLKQLQIGADPTIIAPLDQHHNITGERTGHQQWVLKLDGAHQLTYFTSTKELTVARSHERIANALTKLQDAQTDYRSRLEHEHTAKHQTQQFLAEISETWPRQPELLEAKAKVADLEILVQEFQESLKEEANQRLTTTEPPPPEQPPDTPPPTKTRQKPRALGR